MKHFKILYNGFIIFILVSVLCFQNEWLEMRVNVGHIGLTAMILFYLCVLLYEKRTGNMQIEKNFGTRNSLINLAVCITVIYMLLGAQRIAALPAAIIREAMYLRKIPFGQINTGILTILTVGLLIIMLSERTKKAQSLSGSSDERTVA